MAELELFNHVLHCTIYTYNMALARRNDVIVTLSVQMFVLLLLAVPSLTSQPTPKPTYSRPPTHGSTDDVKNQTQ